MKSEMQSPELAQTNTLSKEVLARVIAELVQSDQELKKAILRAVRSCPNIVTQI